MIHFLFGLLCIKFVEFFESDSFEWGAVGLRVINDETLFTFHFRLVGCDQSLL